MNDQVILAIISTVGVILGGAGARHLIVKWFARDRERTKAASEEQVRKSKADLVKEERQFTDNEEARRWLSGQLTERDRDLGEVLNRERNLLEKVGELSAHVAQLAERSASQATQIDELKVAVAKWGQDYQEMKAERDAYRLAKHDVENKLTAESLRRQLAERDQIALAQEVERLKGQLTAVTGRDIQP
jgi:chromosome segregation ATPase